jgi:hypothetical protein
MTLDTGAPDRCGREKEVGGLGLVAIYGMDGRIICTDSQLVPCRNPGWMGTVQYKVWYGTVQGTVRSIAICEGRGSLALTESTRSPWQLVGGRRIGQSGQLAPWNARVRRLQPYVPRCLRCGEETRHAIAYISTTLTAAGRAASLAISRVVKRCRHAGLAVPAVHRGPSHAA